MTWAEIRRVQARRAQREAEPAEQRLEKQRRAEEQERRDAERAELQLAATGAGICEILESLTPLEAAKLPPELLAELESVLD
jgi:hypothetical protein